METSNSLNPKTTLDELLEQQLLSQRSFNCLRSAGMRTLGDVADFVSDGKDLKSLPKLGLRSELEIIKLLENCPAELSAPKVKIQVRDFSELDQMVKDIFSTAFDMATNSSSTPQDRDDILGYIVLKYPDVKSFFNKLIIWKEKIFKIQPFLNASENISFRRWHIELLERVLKMMEEMGMSTHPQYDQFSSLLRIISNRYEEFSFKEILDYFITEKTDKLLQESYTRLSQKVLNTRTFNFLMDVMPSYRDAVEYFGKPLEEYYKLFPARYMLKTISDIYDVVQRFQALEFDDYDRFLDDGEMLLHRVKKDCPHLHPDECVFVRDFMRRYKVRPLFYLFNLCLRRSRKNEHICFCLYYGLNPERNKYTYAEIYQKTGWAYFKIDEYLRNRTKYQFDFNITPEEWLYYKNLFANSPAPHLITQESGLYKTIVMEENLPQNDFDLFCTLSTLVNKDYFVSDELGFQALTSSTFISEINYRKGWYIKKFIKAFNKGYAKETYYPYSYFGNLPSDFYPDLAYLFSLLIKGMEHLNKITFKQKGLTIGENRLDVTAVVYQILKEAGEPMHVDRIFERFKELHPDHKYSKPSQIRPYLLKDPELIKQIGGESIFGLAQWKHIYYGSLEDLLFETLQNSEKPMPVEDLYKIASQYFPSEDLNTLTSSMKKDYQGRFVELEEGLFGLKEKQYPDRVSSLCSQKTACFATDFKIKLVLKMSIKIK